MNRTYFFTVYPNIIPWLIAIKELPGSWFQLDNCVECSSNKILENTVLIES